MHERDVIPPPAFFSRFFEYVRWGDLRQLETTRPLSDEEYFKDRGWSFGSIHRVMLHMLSAQSLWLDRFEGEKPIWLYDDPRMAAREALEPQWKLTHQRVADFFAAQTPASLTTPVEGDKFRRPLWQLMLQVCNHAAHHRGQLNSMIKLGGATPMEIDYSLWVREQQA